MHARVASGVFLALGFADLAVLDLVLAPRLAAEQARTATAEVAPVEVPRAVTMGETPKPPAEVTAEAPKTEAPKPEVPKPEIPQVANATPDVLFGLESSRITNVQAALALLRLARELRADGGKVVLVRGHADRLGSPVHNLALSRERAESVRHLLIAQGAPGERIAVEAVGDAEPADPSDTPMAWAKNRRVQVLWR